MPAAADDNDDEGTTVGRLGPSQQHWATPLPVPGLDADTGDRGTMVDQQGTPLPLLVPSPNTVS